MTIVVASGKGGTGKTTVAVGLALSLDGEVGLLDCDVEAPNTHLLLGTTHAPDTSRAERFAIEVPRVDTDRCTGCGACAEFCAFGALAVVRSRVLFFDDLCHGCGGCARVCPTGAITEVPHEIGTVRITDSGRLHHAAGELDVGQTLAPPLIRAVKRHARGETIVIDSAPGATCPVVEAARGADVGLLVTENTPFGVHDLEIAAEVFAQVRLPAGIVVNRSGIGYDDERRLLEVSRRFGFPILMRIPYSPTVARAYAEGLPIVEADHGVREELRQLHAKLIAASEAGR